MLKNILYAIIIVTIIAFVLSIAACQKETTASIVEQPAEAGYLTPDQPFSVKFTSSGD